MKKKLLFILALLLTALCTWLLLRYLPDFVFAQGERTWNVLRSVFLAVMLACMVTGILAIFLYRRELAPYLRKFHKFQPLLYQLVRRDFLAKYKRSVLGVLWSLLNPLLTMIVLTVVFSFLFRFEIENYPVYLLSGNIIFTMFNEITNMCLHSVLGGASLMKKVSVPKYIFPLSRALSSLINFAFSFLALIIVMIITGAPFSPSLLYFPIPVLYAFLFSTGIGLMLSAAMVFFRDISYLYGILITAVTYFTPLFYPISIIPDRFRWIISLNPMYHFVECFRTCAIYGGIPTLWQNLICILLSLLSLGLGLVVFNKKQDDFILHI